MPFALSPLAHASSCAPSRSPFSIGMPFVGDLAGLLNVCHCELSRYHLSGQFTFELIGPLPTTVLANGYGIADGVEDVFDFLITSEAT